MEEKEAERREVPETAAPEADAFAEEERRREFVRGDLEDFRAKYPDADVEKLERNEAFRRFCGSRLGRESLAGLYEDYLELSGQARRSAEKRDEEKRSRSTGGGSGGSASALSARQREELAEWNSAFPDMRMSAAEFLRR